MINSIRTSEARSGRNVMSAGFSAPYTNGPTMVSRSCVPMATRVRFRQMLVWSFSCKSMKESYASWSNVTPRSTAATANGRTAFVCGGPDQVGERCEFLIRDRGQGRVASQLFQGDCGKLPLVE